MSLPTNWEPCAGIEGVDIMLSGGHLLFRRGAEIVAWWVRPPSVHSSTAVLAFNGRGGRQKLRNARTFIQARDAVSKYLGR